MKRFLQRILQEIMKKIMLGTSDAWSMSLSSHRHSEPAYYIEDCRILNFVKFTIVCGWRCPKLLEASKSVDLKDRLDHITLQVPKAVAAWRLMIKSNVLIATEALLGQIPVACLDFHRLSPLYRGLGSNESHSYQLVHLYKRV